MIRRAGASDAPAVLTLWNEVIRETTITFTSEPKTEADIDTILASRPVFVAMHGEACVGFAAYGPFRSGDGYAHTKEHAIYLAEAARGRGFGRQLLEAVEDHAKAAGVHSLIGGISGENENGLAFHLAMGFVEVGRVPEAGRKFGRLIDLILVQKRLQIAQP